MKNLFISQTKKSLQTCKPDPVSFSEALAKENLLSFICPGNYLPGSICLPIPKHRMMIMSEQLTLIHLLKKIQQVNNSGPMWHFSMQGLPANDVTIKSCELLPHFFTFASMVAFWSYLQAQRPLKQLFSVALSVTSTYFSALVKVPGYSPVHCSVLSGLSSPSAEAHGAIA